MNLLVVAPEYPPNVIGGGGPVYARVAQGLARLGHSVTVVFGDIANRNIFAKSLSLGSDGDVRLVGVPLLPPPRRFGWAVSATPAAPLASVQLRRFLRQGRWDVAHVHGIGFPLVNACARLLRERGIPYVVTAHGVPRGPFSRGAAFAAIARFYLGGATRTTVENASLVTGISSAVLHDPHFPIERGTVIPNGIDVPSANDPLGRRRERRSPLRVLSVSRLSANKGLDVAIKAVALLRESQSVEYDIYGTDGGDERVLRALVREAGANDYIRFSGTFAPEDREQLFADHDVLLVPSRVEGFGLAALEGLASGIPVIASPVDGLRQFLSEENALLVPNHDGERWCTALARVATETPAETQRRADAGIATARAYAWEPIVRRYEGELSSARAFARFPGE